VINNVVLVGRLGNDPELTYTNSGTALCKFRLAVDRPPRRTEDGGRGEKQTDWLDITCWAKVAENVSQYLDKGSLVGVEGRMQSRTWERQDGSKGYGVEVNAQNVRFLARARKRPTRDEPGAAERRPSSNSSSRSSRRNSRSSNSRSSNSRNRRHPRMMAGPARKQRQQRQIRKLRQRQRRERPCRVEGLRSFAAHRPEGPASFRIR